MEQVRWSFETSSTWVTQDGHLKRNSIFESLNQVKLLCFSDKCLVLSPDQLPTRNFVLGLKHHLCRSKICLTPSLKMSLLTGKRGLSCIRAPSRSLTLSTQCWRAPLKVWQGSSGDTFRLSNQHLRCYFRKWNTILKQVSSSINQSLTE